MGNVARPSRRTIVKAGAAGAALTAIGSTPSVAANPAPARTSGTTLSPAPFGAPNPRNPVPGVRIEAPSGDRPAGWNNQTRAEVLARNGIVATSQPLAAQAGVRVLAEGGTSADAAVATAAVLGLVEEVSASIGGDSFALHYHAADRRVYGLNSAGWAPSAWTPEYFARRGHTAKYGMPDTGIDSATVPGAVEGWDQLRKRFGNRGFDTLLAPAVELAEQGFGLTERIHDSWSGAVELLRKDPDAAHAFLVDGNVPPLYGIFRNRELANAYRLLQREGRDGFYRGAIAEAVVAKSKRVGGAMNRADLAEFRAEWVEPISVEYHGYRMHQLPAPNQGFAALIMLNIIKQFAPVLGYDLARLGPRSPMFWHLIIEAKKLAYDDLNRYNGDPRFTHVPFDMLLSDRHGAELCRRIDPARATPPKVPGAINSGTVYLTAADRWGNMTSFIYSNFDSFGSGVGIPGYGFPLQNRGALFNLDPESPNIVAPRKRPYHTLMPAFVTRDGHPVLSFGNMGGSEQAQAQALEMVFMINLGLNPQAATDAARFYHNQFDDSLELERELDDTVGAELKRKGHKATEPTSGNTGGYQAIHFTPEKAGDWPASTGPGGPVNGIYRAASDHRKDGAAIGW
ncbi:gamma-glutamyltransferase family protein [Sciscionella marina]|uniref:gamma-glutamyltransferase family protein n=1 Tax=Sciscionella marina TaxID=508770 RepID=UPI0003618189|nr:gamma-glutamyltransferase family protein [Sciscionella marina]